MLQYWWVNNHTLIIADFFMKATRVNIEANNRVCIAVWDDQSGESYKFKGTATYQITGEMYEKGKNFVQKSNPGKIPKGVVVVKIKEVYDLFRGPNAGNLIAKE